MKRLIRDMLITPPPPHPHAPRSLERVGTLGWRERRESRTGRKEWCQSQLKHRERNILLYYCPDSSVYNAAPIPPPHHHHHQLLLQNSDRFKKHTEHEDCDAGFKVF